MIQTCGACNGQCYVYGPAYDREGRAQEPRKMVCEYCGGEGVCEDGDQLQPVSAPKPGPDHAADLARRGNPAWG